MKGILNITSKTQNVVQTGVTFNGTLHAGYTLNYNYTKPHQLDSLGDNSYRMENTGDSGRIKKNDKYSYDANGNLIYINTLRFKKDGTADSPCWRRQQVRKKSTAGPCWRNQQVRKKSTAGAGVPPVPQHNKGNR
jgi:hypothetical protein